MKRRMCVDSSVEVGAVLSSEVKLVDPQIIKLLTALNQSNQIADTIRVQLVV